ncbi:hypothetical protein [Roseobacter weihaiensis]|uniref:hypothetical protein n=1 Tax=Roseobacter weihaiensis TaxID=2763262 RepID=UPI001D0AF577|nr:hypothetical protein [Roseobacter sp. H9]
MFAVSPDNRAQYYKYLASLNFICADEADKKIGLLPGYEIAAPPPVMTLCAHAIELSLKAFLLENGMIEKETRKIGHDLVAAWGKAKELSEDLPEIDENVLAIISDLLVSDRLRYGERSNLGTVPVYGPLSDLVKQMLELCGAPNLAETVN